MTSEVQKVLYAYQKSNGSTKIFQGREGLVGIACFHYSGTSRVKKRLSGEKRRKHMFVNDCKLGF